MSDNKFFGKIMQNPVYLAITGIFGVVLLFFLVLYLAVPSYRFDESEPFHGEFVFNPYQEVGSELFTNPIYIDFRSDSVENHGINSYEYGFTIVGTRFLCLGYDEVWKMDYPFLQSIHYKQYNLDKLNKTARLVAPAHPSRGFKKGEFTNLDHYRVVEALSENDNSLYYWDIALSNGHRANIIASGEKAGFTTACLSENKPEDIYKSLETGNSYGVSFRGKLKEVPVLEYVTLRNDTISVSVSDKAKEIRFIGQNAVTKKAVENSNHAFYFLKKDDSYIRTEIEFENGNILYLNPIVRHQYQYFFDPDHAFVMKGRTYLMWAVYVIVVICYSVFMILRVKESRSDKRG